jgi:hypothetical protein
MYDISSGGEWVEGGKASSAGGDLCIRHGRKAAECNMRKSQKTLCERKTIHSPAEDLIYLL